MTEAERSQEFNHGNSGSILQQLPSSLFACGVAAGKHEY